MRALNLLVNANAEAGSSPGGESSAQEARVEAAMSLRVAAHSHLKRR